MTNKPRDLTDDQRVEFYAIKVRIEWLRDFIDQASDYLTTPARQGNKKANELLAQYNTLIEDKFIKNCSQKSIISPENLVNEKDRNEYKTANSIPVEKSCETCGWYDADNSGQMCGLCWRGSDLADNWIEKKGE